MDRLNYYPVTPLPPWGAGYRPAWAPRPGFSIFSCSQLTSLGVVDEAAALVARVLPASGQGQSNCRAQPEPDPDRR